PVSPSLENALQGPRFSCQSGPSPISGASVFPGHAERRDWFAAIAQLVEHVIRNDGVTGSSPVCGTSQINHLASFARYPKRPRVGTVSANALRRGGRAHG